MSISGLSSARISRAASGTTVRRSLYPGWKTTLSSQHGQVPWDIFLEATSVVHENPQSLHTHVTWVLLFGEIVHGSSPGFFSALQKRIISGCFATESSEQIGHDWSFTKLLGVRKNLCPSVQINFLLIESCVLTSSRGISFSGAHIFSAIGTACFKLSCKLSSFLHSGQPYGAFSVILMMRIWYGGCVPAAQFIHTIFPDDFDTDSGVISPFSSLLKYFAASGFASINDSKYPGKTSSDVALLRSWHGQTAFSASALNEMDCAQL